MKSLRPQRLAKAIQLSLLLALPAVATAQDAAPADAQGTATTLDTVTVTGSRIKKADLETQVPVQTLTRADIERTGLTSVADVLQEITGSGSALNTKFNSSGNFGFPPDGSGVGAGSATVDLRHLGSKRVLVLVDGIRWVNEASASGVSSSTDLNTIPLAIVERIEVLEDGASSLYGSDAIAGVVNIITRRSIDGFQISGNYGQYEPGDGKTYGADFGWGGSTDRSSWFFGASYVKQEEIFSRDREHAGVPVPGTGLTFGSSATPNGRFTFLDPRCPSVDDDDDPATPNVNLCNITTPNGSSFSPTPTFPGDFIPFATANRFNFAQYNMLLTPSERTGVFGQYRFNFSDNLSMYAKALYNRRESVNQAAPEPIFLGPAGATGNPYADNITISATNPFNPFGVDLVSGENLLLAARRPVEGGPRVYEQEVDTMYVGAGLEGSFGVGERTWFWDVNAAYSKNEADQTNFGSYNIRNISLALGDLATCQATPGCVPLNIFGGPGTITPEMLAWISPIVRDRSENELSLFAANLSGDVFDMWAGPLAFAAGYEYRKYEGSYTPDPLNYVTMPDGTVENHYNGVPSQPTAGEYDVNEVYVELSVPLLKETFGKSLDLSLAGRYSDYSTSGGEFTPKYGLRWQVTDELLFRTTYAEGFRAPSIGELFGSAARFDATLDDPCQVGLDGSPPTGSAANCAALGVPAGSQQVNSQISVTTGGNPDLDAERSRSFSAGMVWTPSLLEDSAVAKRVDFEVTFYRHSVDGAIQAIDAQTQLDLCVATLDPVYCDGISRASTGDINGFNNRLQNLGVIKTDGWDVDVFWTFPETSFGVFKLNWQNTFVTRYEAFGADGSLQPRRPGIEVNDSAIPEWTSTTTLDWRHGNWNASWTARYISELEEQCGDAASFPVCSDPASGTNTLDATTFHDLQVGYKIDWLKGLQLSAGVNNVFGEEPPICLSCSLNGYDPSTYDAPGGGFYYVRADLRF